MKNVLIDTSILYEIFLENSVCQRILSHHLEKAHFFINIHILDEVFTLFRARNKDDIAFRILDPLLSEQLFALNPVLPADVEAAAKLLKKFRDKRLSFTDAIILAQAAHQGFQIWTTDEEMEKTCVATIFHE